MDKNKRPAFIRTIVYFVVILGSFLHLLSIGWMKWGDIFIDTGEQLWIPAQILKGKVFYEDFFSIFGFFPAHFLAFIYKIFGVRIISLVGCGIALTVLMSVLLYKISAFFVDKKISFLIILTFLYVFAFGYYVNPCIFNFILPYRFESEFFILFISLALLLFIKFIFSGKEKYLLFWSGAMSFAFYSRILMPIFPYLAFLAAGEIHIRKSSDKRPWRRRLYLISPFFITLSGYMCYALFMTKTRSFSVLTQNLYYCLSYAATEKTFSMILSGLDNTAINIFLMFGSFAAHLLTVSLLVMSIIGVSSFSTGKKKTCISFILAIIAIAIVLICTQNPNIILMQYRCLPLILIIGTAYSIKTLRSSYYKEPLALLTLFLVSLSLIPRIFLRTIPYPYGFYLLPLSLICYYLFFFKLLRNFLRTYSNKYIKSYSSVLGVLFIFLIIPYAKKSSSMYAAKNIKVETAKGPIFFSEEPEASGVRRIIQYLKDNTQENDTLAVGPEGIELNYLSQRENSLKCYSYNPPTIKLEGEEAGISALIQNNMDYFVILRRETGEYGSPRFGIDYAQKIVSWIYDHYSIVEQVGPAPFTSDKFGAIILKRKKLLRGPMPDGFTGPTGGL